MKNNKRKYRFSIVTLVLCALAIAHVGTITFTTVGIFASVDVALTYIYNKMTSWLYKNRN